MANPPPIHRSLEVPLPIPGDLRAWDARLVVERRAIGTEFETRSRDIQALPRRLALKAGDGSVDVVILVLRNTRYNRRLLRLHADELKEAFPVPGRTALECLRAGRYP